MSDFILEKNAFEKFILLRYHKYNFQKKKLSKKPILLYPWYFFLDVKSEHVAHL